MALWELESTEMTNEVGVCDFCGKQNLESWYGNPDDGETMCVPCKQNASGY